MAYALRLALIAFFLFSETTRAAPPIDPCGKVFSDTQGQWLRSLFQRPTKAPTKVEFSKDVEADLRSGQQILLNRKQSRTKPYSEDPPPSALVFGQTSYRVQAFLGSGGEGEVFLVENNQHKYILKRFYSQTGLTENITLAGRLKKGGLNVLLPVETNMNMALYPFVDGINVQDILRPNPYLPPPVSEATTVFIREKFEQFLRESSKFERIHPGNKILPSNVLLDLKTGHFIISDPQ